jgi:hypothetical protein
MFMFGSEFVFEVRWFWVRVTASGRARPPPWRGDHEHGDHEPGEHEHEPSRKNREE